MIPRILVWLLKRSLSEKNRELIMNVLLEGIEAVPMNEVISVESRQILVRGKPISTDQAISLQTSADTALRSAARNLIRDHVRFMAMTLGYLKNDKSDPYQAMFYKAALWYANEEDALLKGLAGNTDLYTP